MPNINYQLVMDKILDDISDSHSVPTLLLHSCCAPCTSYVIEYLSRYFSIIICYYNPNIMPEQEYQLRLNELRKLISVAETIHDVKLIESIPYDNDLFLHAVKGMEHLPEGGARCSVCFDIRLNFAAEQAKKINADYFATTLTVSPHKNAALINDIGFSAAQKYGIPYLASDFKKRNGYKRSIELSKLYDLYRQNYCGCQFSKPML